MVEDLWETNRHIDSRIMRITQDRSIKLVWAVKWSNQKKGIDFKDIFSLVVKMSSIIAIIV